MRRLFRVVLALALAWLSAGILQVPVMASPPPAHAASYAYDSAHVPSALTDTAADRGPPSCARTPTTYDAVDRWPNGTSACSDKPKHRAASAYDDPGRLVRMARSMAATAGQGQNTEQASVVSARAGVAAEAGARAARQVDASWGPAYQYGHGGPMTAIEHINYRHSFNSGFANVSRFAEGTGARQINGYVDEALRYGNVGQNGASVVHDFGRTIGYDRGGNAVSGLQVWVRDGYIRTAYPVAP